MATQTGDCLASVPQLSRLTSLAVKGNWCGSAAMLQQLLSQPLPLRQLLIISCDLGEHAVLDLVKMTLLTELNATAWDVTYGSVLPAQLQHFAAGAPQPHALSVLLPLKQLQRLRLFTLFSDQRPLLQLAQLPALQHLSLHYSATSAAAGAAAAWPQLPQLRELDVMCCDNVPLPHQMAAILATVGWCSSLTRLALQVLESPTGSRHDARNIAACGKLAGVTNLRDLYIYWGSSLAPGDAEALTALTSLTSLGLVSLGSAMDDATAAALARSMPQLQDLDLGQCELGSMTCLAAIAKLVHLTSLNLQDWHIGVRSDSKLTRAGLMLLTGLTSLQRLRLCWNEAVTKSVVGEYWAAVRTGRNSNGISSSFDISRLYDWAEPWDT
jgi:hypothetical protein